MKNKTINRRNFLQMTAASSAAAFIPSALQAAPEELTAAKMTYRKLGKTGLKLPVFALGPIKGHSAAMVKAAYRNGVTYFDTAHAYREGQTDTLLGGLMKSGELPRNKIVLSTKVKMHDKVAPEKFDEVFMQRFNESMERLGVDYVDILFSHQADTVEEVKDPRIHRLLQEIRKSGRTKHIGISVHGYEPDMLQAVIDSKIYEVVMVSYNYKQKDSELIKQKIDDAVNAGIGVIAMKLMAGAKGVDAASAMKWALQNKNITSALMGCGTFDEYQADLDAALHLKMTPEDYRRLELSHAANDIYCQRCQKCLKECPHGLPIPDLMRSYMYMYGYNFPSEAKKVLDEVGVKASPCGSCTDCKVKCTAGFDIAAKVDDITRLCNVPMEFLV